MIVWLLIVAINGGGSYNTGGSAFLIDNLADAPACLKAKAVVEASLPGARTTCVPVRKIGPDMLERVR